jgi:hypothetical protein
MCWFSSLNSFVTPTTIFTKLFKGENKHILQYLQNYSGERTNTYEDIYKTIEGRELAHTTIFKNYSGERTNTYYNIYKTI